MKALVKRVLRALAFPVRRLLDPRFADTHRRLGEFRLNMHGEFTHTRWELEQATKRIEETLARYEIGHGESLQAIGVQLRRVQDDLEALGQRLDRLEREAAARSETASAA